MDRMNSWQLLPILSLVAYIMYLLYYYVIPTLHLRILWFIAQKKQHCSSVIFSEYKITVKFTKNGEERVIEQFLDDDIPSRFKVPALCSKFKGILADIKNMP